MGSVALTGTIYMPGGHVAWVEAAWKVRCVRYFTDGTFSYPGHLLKGVTDEAGEFSTVLSVPDNGAAEYEFVLPSLEGIPFWVSAADGAITLEEILAGAGQPGDQDTLLTLLQDYLKKSGGTMTGPIVLAGAPTADLHAATKAYVDTAGGAVDSVFGRTGVVVAAASDYDADQVDFAPAGNLAATDVQAAIEELDSEKEAAGAAAAVQANLTAHENDTTAVHGIADTSLLLDTADIGVSVAGQGAFAAHVADVFNPHGVTAAQAGALAIANDLNDLNNAATARLNLFGVAFGVTGGGTLALGGFTLTVPATGTAALRGVANTFSAVNTFSAGLTVPQNSESERFGAGASCAGNNQVAIGFGASVTGGGNSPAVAVGSGATATGALNTALGRSANAGHSAAVCVGHGATSTANNQLVSGSGAAPITDVYIGNGVVNASPGGVAYHGTGGSGTNVAGGALDVAGGISTGNANGGRLRLRVSPAGVSGSGVNALSTGLELDTSGGVLRIGVFNVTPAARASAYTITNGVIDRTLDCNSGATNTDRINELADFVYTLVSDLASYGWLQLA